MIQLRGYLDRVLEAYSKGAYYEEVKFAKEEFFERAGRVAEGSEVFETQMRAFLDWYIFDRPLKIHDVAPVKMFVLEHVDTLTEEDQQIYIALAKSVHSLFELTKVKGSDIYIKDLFDGVKYVVRESEVNTGFSKKDLFEARLIEIGDRLYFGNSFIFHPGETRPFVLKQVKSTRYLESKEKLKLLHKLASMKLKTDQYSHIDVKHIYTEKPLF